LDFPPRGCPGRFSYRVLRAVLESLQGVKFLGDLRGPPKGLAYTIGAKLGHLKNPISDPKVRELEGPLSEVKGFLESSNL
jgi:hypothetical protein